MVAERDWPIAGHSSTCTCLTLSHSHALSSSLSTKDRLNCLQSETCPSDSGWGAKSSWEAEGEVLTLISLPPPPLPLPSLVLFPQTPHNLFLFSSFCTIIIISGGCPPVPSTRDSRCTTRGNAIYSNFASSNSNFYTDFELFSSWVGSREIFVQQLLYRANCLSYNRSLEIRKASTSNITSWFSKQCCTSYLHMLSLLMLFQFNQLFGK